MILRKLVHPVKQCLGANLKLFYLTRLTITPEGQAALRGVMEQYL